MSHHWNDKTDVLTTNLCLLRKRYRLTQPQVAKAAHIDRSSYAYYELGKTHPRLNTLVSLLSFYGVSMDMILGVVPMAFPPGALPFAAPRHTAGGAEATPGRKYAVSPAAPESGAAMDGRLFVR